MVRSDRGLFDGDEGTERDKVGAGCRASTHLSTQGENAPRRTCVEFIFSYQNRICAEYVCMSTHKGWIVLSL